MLPPNLNSSLSINVTDGGPYTRAKSNVLGGHERTISAHDKIQ